MKKKSKSKRKTKPKSVEKLLIQLNDTLTKNLIFNLALQKVPHQSIRKIAGVKMKYITELLRPLKDKRAK